MAGVGAEKVEAENSGDGALPGHAVPAAPADATSASAPTPTSANTKRGSRNALLVVLGALLFAYLPLLFGQVIFFRDPAFWNYPARVFLRAALRTGDSPFWNPDIALGLPVLANPLYGVFYPPNWLYALVPAAGVVHMLAWQSFLHMAWGSVGIFLVARRLGVGATAACVGAFAWGLSGYTTSQWTAGLLLLADAWVPWCAVGFLSLLRRIDEGARAPSLLRSVAGAALPVAFSFLLGEVFVALMGIVFGLLTAAAARSSWRASAASSPPPPWRAPLGFVGALAMALSIGAVVVLPARALVGATERGAPLEREVAERCSTHPLRLIEWIAPGSMGDPYERYPAGPVIGEPTMSGLPLSLGMYFGAAAIAVALCAFRRRGGGLPFALGVFAIAALVVTFGSHTPVHGLLRRLVPPLGYMRYPEKYTVLVVGWATLLVALGAERLLAARDRPWARVLALVLALFALAALAERFFPGEWAGVMRPAALQGAAAAAVVLALVPLFSRRPRAAAALLVAAVALDLAVAAWPLQGFGPASIANDPPPAAEVIGRASVGAVARPRVYRSEKVEPSVGRFVAVSSNPEAMTRSKQTLIHNVNTTFGMATLPGYDAAIPKQFLSLWELGTRSGGRTMRLLGIDYAVLPIVDPAAPDPRPGLVPLLDPLPGARLYRVPGKLPRVFVVGRAEVLDDAAASRSIFADDVVAGRRALLAPHLEARPLAGADGPVGNCALRSFSNGRLVATCNASAPAVAVFTEQHGAGWRASVDGVPAPLLRANLVMRAVQLPPGAHEIVLTYTPPLRAGATAAGLGLAALLACFGLARVLEWRGATRR